MTQIDIATSIAKIAHAGQTYGGQDYFKKHVMGVARRVASDHSLTYGHIVVALLHDTIEDTAVTADDLLTLGISDRLVDAVQVLTKLDGETYFEYIHRVAFDPFARTVKLADLEENLSNSTYGEPRHERYTKAKAILQEASS